MKNILLCICILLASLCAQAQEHLSFKGIPIEGNISSFCQKLKQKGFTQQRTQGREYFFEGEFTGREVSVKVTADEHNSVFGVDVILPDSDSWSTLTETYDHYKNLYIEKYGRPVQCKERNPASTNSNISYMLELCEEKVSWKSTFKAHGGSIKLSIEPTESYGLQGYVLIKYEDHQNTMDKRKSDLEEI